MGIEGTVAWVKKLPWIMGLDPTSFEACIDFVTEGQVSMEDNLSINHYVRR